MNNITCYVAYYRVSTQRQGQSGLGLQSQREMVDRFVQGRGWNLITEYIEVESGKVSNRPQLKKAIETCKIHNCKLVIAKLDRLTRNLHFLTGLIESKVDFVCADMPEANTLTIHILGVVAEYERNLISERTKKALEQAKKNGVQLGNPKWDKSISKARQARSQRTRDFNDRIYMIIKEIKDSGISTYRGIAHILNTRGIRTYNNKKWYATTVKNIIG